MWKPGFLENFLETCFHSEIYPKKSVYRDHHFWRLLLRLSLKVELGVLLRSYVQCTIDICSCLSSWKLSLNDLWHFFHPSISENRKLWEPSKKFIHLSASSSLLQHHIQFSITMLIIRVVNGRKQHLNAFVVLSCNFSSSTNIYLAKLGSLWPFGSSLLDV